ncbi:helix-turn-helix domain-containing protein [Kitasatospora sp. NPDC058218]|uniref:helix-turn-helix domain-containing protein n=1 Tax=Kitasatospora sp. NPDC058218 TaxID=3346385 RepID=UPI0036DE2CFD
MTRKTSTNPNLRASAGAVFGAVVRRHRLSKRMSQDELAVLVPCSRSQVSRIESGTRTPQEDFVTAADRWLETGGELMELWREIDWYAKVDHPDWFRRYAQMEAKAVKVQEYNATWISGLLQTEEYARALFEHGDAAGNPQEIDERLAARLNRQQRFLDPNGPFLVNLLSEAALNINVGGAGVMERQLDHLIRMAERPNNLIHVVPFSLGERILFNASATLITGPDGKIRIYSEIANHGHFVEDPREVQRFSRVYDLLQADALSVRESMALIRRARERYLNVHRHTLLLQPHLAKVQLQRQQWRSVRRSG